MNLQDDITPTEQQDDFTRRLCHPDYGYIAAKRLDDGSYVCLTRLLFTVAICVDVDEIGWRRRYCYEDLAACLGAYQDMQSRDDVPEGWIAKRPKTEEDGWTTS